VGTGNIAGVATAIGFGGPGAIFWMWMVAFLGAATAYVESALGQIYKVEHHGLYRGGPAYYIEKGLGWRAYAIVFAVATVIACGVLLPGVQTNSIAASMENAFAVAPAVTGTLIVILLGLILRLREPAAITMLSLVALFQLITSPIASHMVGRASFRAGQVDVDRLVVDELSEVLPPPEPPA